MQKGKLIVIEGVDGSGKSTQFKLLRDRLNSEGYTVESLHFPRHGEGFFGRMVDDYLNGKFGNATQVNPYLASMIYAGDRWEAKDKLEDWLNQGSVVLLDRYMTSNKGHQVGKLKTDEEKLSCIAWLDKMEYETFKIPRPDLVIYLDVPPEFNLGLLAKREHSGKEYIKGKQDQHESSEVHLRDAGDAYRFVTDKYDYWKRINCVKDDSLMGIEEIHDMVWGAVKEVLD